MTTASSTPILDTAAANRTPTPEIIEALKRVPPLHGMEDSELEWLATHGTERKFPAGATLFQEGDVADTMSILLKGEVHVRRERGAPAALFIGRTGMITGLLPFSRMKTYGGHGYAVSDLWGLEFSSQPVCGDDGRGAVDDAALRHGVAGPGARSDAAGAAGGEAECFGQACRKPCA